MMVNLAVCCKYIRYLYDIFGISTDTRYFYNISVDSAES